MEKCRYLAAFTIRGCVHSGSYITHILRGHTDMGMTHTRTCKREGEHRCAASAGQYHLPQASGTKQTSHQAPSHAPYPHTNDDMAKYKSESVRCKRTKPPLGVEHSPLGVAQGSSPHKNPYGLLGRAEQAPACMQHNTK
jgi:hypothetical protein